MQMPFTFSHPALVLPLSLAPQKWFSTTGLVIGSMVPDFEYFFRMRIHSECSHSLLGTFWFSLPVGLLLAFIYHNLVRNVLIRNAPKFIRFRLSQFQNFNWNASFKNRWIVVLVSLTIGSLSHLFWDAFTHEHGYFVAQIDALRNTVNVFGVHMPLYRIIQHASTLLGGAVVLLVCFQLPKQKDDLHVQPRYWVAVCAFATLIFAIRFGFGLELRQYGNVIVSLISSVLFALILAPLALKLSKKNR